MSGAATNGSMLRSALRYARKGLRVVPLNGKVPITEHGYKDASDSAEQISAWWAKSPHANVGIRIGAEAGYVVLDVDRKSGGLGTLATLMEKHGRLPETRTVDTGDGGLHLHFRYDPRATKNGYLDPDHLPGLELRTIGYEVVPPSRHPVTAKRYTWRKVRQLAALPEWLLAFCEQTKPAQVAPAVPDKIVEGHRNVTLTSIAGTMRKRGCTANEILAALRVANAERCTPRLEDGEVERIATSVASYPSGNALENASAAPREGVPAETKLRFMTAAEISSQGFPEVPWIAEPWVASGCITLLDGKVKAAGKTTFALALVRAVLDGEEFLGR